MSIKDLVKDNKVRFLFYRKGELWYEVVKWVHVSSEHPFIESYYEPIFQFPVPISDCGDGQFNAEDKAIIFMRYIRQYLEVLEKEKNIS